VDFETLKYEKDGRIVTITLNRPEAMNTVNDQMLAELSRAWEAFNADREAWVAIYTGAGERALCAGVDLRQPMQAAAGASDRKGGNRIKLTSRDYGVEKPVICAINGLATGAGLAFIADSDLVIAAEHVQFLNTGVSLGIVAAHGPIVFARKMGFEAAMRMFLVGNKERLSAQQALTLGLVSEVVPKEELLPAARRLAEKIAQNSPTAVRLAKRIMWEALDLPLSGAIDNFYAVLESVGRYPDQAEGRQAFMEKRSPNWANP
jgi:enoyl-CoA hydratase/carnithine racemase